MGFSVLGSGLKAQKGMGKTLSMNAFIKAVDGRFGLATLI
jgi:hypothetical protein